MVTFNATALLLTPAPPPLPHSHVLLKARVIALHVQDSYLEWYGSRMDDQQRCMHFKLNRFKCVCVCVCVCGCVCVCVCVCVCARAQPFACARAPAQLSLWCAIGVVCARVCVMTRTSWYVLYCVLCVCVCVCVCVRAQSFACACVPRKLRYVCTSVHHGTHKLDTLFLRKGTAPFHILGENV